MSVITEFTKNVDARPFYAVVGATDLTVEKALKEAEKEIGAPAKITGFIRFALGEGIEKEASDFAAEVAAAVKK